MPRSARRRFDRGRPSRPAEEFAPMLAAPAEPAAAPPPSRRRRRTQVFFTATAVVLTIASSVVIFAGMSDGPYLGPIQSGDAFVQVGVAGALLALWCVWAAALVVLVVRRRVHPAALAMLAGAALLALYLTAGANRYVRDIIRAHHS